MKFKLVLMTLFRLFFILRHSYVCLSLSLSFPMYLSLYLSFLSLLWLPWHFPKVFYGIHAFAKYPTLQSRKCIQDGWVEGGGSIYLMCRQSKCSWFTCKMKLGGLKKDGASVLSFLCGCSISIYGYWWIFARSKLSKRGAGENGICNDAQQRQRQPRSATFNF